MYRRIHFTACQCPLLGLCIYLLTIPTVCEMSGLAHTIAYIKLPTTFQYGTCNMYSPSASVEGDNCAESLKWEANEVLTGFVCSVMPNCCSTFFKYCFWDKLTLPRALSLYISMPRIFLTSLRSWLSWVFNFSISSLLFVRLAYHRHTIANKWKILLIACENTHNDQIYFFCTFALS